MSSASTCAAHLPFMSTFPSCVVLIYALSISVVMRCKAPSMLDLSRLCKCLKTLVMIRLRHLSRLGLKNSLISLFQSVYLLQSSTKRESPGVSTPFRLMSMASVWYGTFIAASMYAVTFFSILSLSEVRNCPFYVSMGSNSRLSP